MTTQLEEIMVECLSETLVATLCSESTEMISNISSIIGKYSLYNLIKTHTFESFKSHVVQNHECHCLLIDTRCSFLVDIFSVIRELPYWFPIILFTDSITSDHCITLGILKNNDDTYSLTPSIYPDIKSFNLHNKTIYICPLRGYRQMFDILQKESLKKRLFTQQIPKELAHAAMYILFNTFPITVETWAKELSLSPRKLQRILKYYSSLSPKKIICLYHSYLIAFNTIDKTLNCNNGIVNAYYIDEPTKKRVMEYVLSRRSQFITKK